MTCCQMKGLTQKYIRRSWYLLTNKVDHICLGKCTPISLDNKCHWNFSSFLISGSEESNNNKVDELQQPGHAKVAQKMIVCNPSKISMGRFGDREPRRSILTDFGPPSSSNVRVKESRGPIKIFTVHVLRLLNTTHSKPIKRIKNPSIWSCSEFYSRLILIISP